MGLLASLHGTRSYSLKDPALNRLFGIGNYTDAGLFVSDEAAMMYSAVYAAVNRLSSDVAKLPFNLMKARKGGGADHYTESKTYKLLKFRPNPEMTDLSFRQALTAHALTLGGGYAEIERERGTGKPVNLWPITPNRIVQKRKDNGRLYYLVDNTTELSPENVLHIHGLGWEGTTGYALLHHARQAVGLAMAAEKFASSFFSNGTQPGGIISLDGSRDAEELKGYRDAIEAIHGGPEKAFKFLLLDNGAKFTAYTGTNQDAQMDELRDKQIDEVARFFNMPAHKLGNLKHATFSNIEQQDLEYYKGAVTDWITIWEKECTAKLVPSLEQGIQYFKHNANAFLRGDITSRYTALGIARDKGIISANEWRDWEDMNPQEGPQGDEYLVQQAMIPADMLTPLVESQIKKNETPAPAPAPTPTEKPKADNETQRKLDAAILAAQELRAKLDAEIEKRAQAEGMRDALSVEVEHHKLEAAAKRADAELLSAELAAKAAVSEADRVRLASVTAAADAAHRDLADRTAELAAKVAEADELRAREREAATNWHNLSVIEASLRSEHEAFRAAVDAKAQAESEARAEAERQQQEARAAHAAEVADLQAKAREVMARAEAAEQDAETVLTEAEAALAKMQAEQRAATIAAHRHLFVHVMRGALEREADRARRAQQSPEKMRQWIDSWYDSHAELMYAALLPAVKVHLAWLGDAADPGDLTRQLVTEHITTSRRQLQTVVQGDAEALAGSLAGLLRRWDTERIHEIPDRLMEREVAHGRT